MIDQVIVNGIVYNVLETRPDRLIVIARPMGSKRYIARRLPDSAVYGSNRASILTLDTLGLR